MESKKPMYKTSLTLSYSEICDLHWILSAFKSRSQDKLEELENMQAQAKAKEIEFDCDANFLIRYFNACIDKADWFLSLLFEENI